MEELASFVTCRARTSYSWAFACSVRRSTRRIFAILAVFACFYYAVARQAVQKTPPDPTPAVQKLLDAGEATHDPKLQLPLYERALALAKASGDIAGQAVAQNDLGAYYYSAGQTGKALDYFNLALLTQRQAGDGGAEARTLNNIGFVYDNSSQEEKALSYYEQALQVSRSIGDRKAEGAALDNIGGVYGNLGQEQQALDYYDQALAVRRAQGNRADQATTLNNIANVYYILGDVSEALGSYNRVLELDRLEGDKSGVASALHNIGFMYNFLGQSQKALQYYEQAITVRREADDRDGEAITLSAIGSVYAGLKQDIKALDFYSRAISILREVGDRKTEAAELGNIGNAYDNMGQEQNALEYYNRALEMSSQIGDRGTKARVLENIGHVYYYLQRAPEALDYTSRAIASLREIGDLSGEAVGVFNLAIEMKAAGNVDSAIAFAKLSINLYQALRESVHRLSEAAQLSYKQKIATYYSSLCEYLAIAGRIPEAIQTFSLFEDEKYQEFLSTRGAATASPDLRIEFTHDEAKYLNGFEAKSLALRDLGDKIAPLEMKDRPTPAQQSELKSLKNQEDECARDMVAYITSEKLAIRAAGGRVLGANSEQAKLQSLLAKERLTAAVYAWADDKEIHLLLIGPRIATARSASVNSALGKTALSDAILTYARGLRTDRYDMRPLGSKLYSLLVAPIAKDLEGYKTVLWCTEGILRYVPIDALYDASNHKYAVQEFAPALFTPTMLKDLQASRTLKAEWRGVGFGVSGQHPGFSALPNVRTELKQIFQPGVLPGKEILDTSFTQASFQTAMALRPAVVHIASHFSFDPAKGMDSFLLLGDGTHFTLADLNSKKEFFKGVDLLTLSACQTGVGAPGADGSEVEGFALLAQKQGARSVLSTLWPVEDQSTAALMADFYRIRHNNKSISKVEALREAQLDMLGGKQRVSLMKRSPNVQTGANLNLPPYPSGLPRSSHPYYWAGFTLAGDWQ